MPKIIVENTPLRKIISARMALFSLLERMYLMVVSLREKKIIHKIM